MESKLVTKKYINSFKAHLSNRNESVRFYDNNYFLKIIKDHYLKDERIKTIERLEELEHPNAVTPEFLLHDRKRTIGYASINYSDYSYIDILLNDDSISFKERKELMVKLAEIIKFFESKKFAYYDIHSKNILYKNKDIKVIDLDGGVFTKCNDNILYNGTLRYSNYKLALYAISFLYQMDDYDFYTYINSNPKIKENFMKSIPKELYNFFHLALSQTYEIIPNSIELIDSINEELVMESKQLLELKNTNYY